MSRLEPWQLEGEDVLEVIVDDVRVAWSLDDDVYIYTGSAEERGNGYKRIGSLEWDEEPEYTIAQNENHNEERLCEFVRAYLKRNAFQQPDLFEEK